MKKILLAPTFALVTVVAASITLAAPAQPAASFNNNLPAIVHGQVYGKGPTKQAAYASAFRKIPPNSGFRPLNVSYTSGAGWTCRMEYGK